MGSRVEEIFLDQPGVRVGFVLVGMLPKTLPGSNWNSVLVPGSFSGLICVLFVRDRFFSRFTYLRSMIANASIIIEEIAKITLNLTACKNLYDC